MSFFEFINSQYSNIKFTFEKQNDSKFSFLDILVDNSSRNCVFLDLLRSAVKLALSKLSLTENFKTSNTSSVFHKSLTTIWSRFQTLPIVIRFIHTSLTIPRYSDQKSRTVNDENNTRYFKLPFIGRYSRLTELKLRILMTN